MSDRIREKLQILADASKYDRSCCSSGSDHKHKGKGLPELINIIFSSFTYHLKL